MSAQRRRERDGEVLLAPAAIDAYAADWFDRSFVGDDDPGFSGGRGSIAAIRTGIGVLVRRQYLRGGLPRHLVRDRYLWTGAGRTRAFREFCVLQRLHAHGLAVAEPIAARYRRHGLFYRAALLTRLIPQASTLSERLSSSVDPAPLLAAVAGAVAALHRHRVWHADLNASNVLLDAEDRVWLIDFDRAQTGVANPARLAANLDRLLRSLRKLLAGTPALARVEQAWPHFLETYRERFLALSSRSQ